MSNQRDAIDLTTMELVVRALRCPSPVPSGAPHARFGSAGGCIGRSRACALPLVAAGRHVSREHLEIRWRDGRYGLAVVSRLNGCRVDDRELRPGATVDLAGGEHIELGGYLLVVELQAGAVDACAGAGPDPTGAPDLLAALGPVGGGAGPLAAFLGPEGDAAPTAPLSPPAQRLYRPPDFERALPASLRGAAADPADDIFSILEREFAAAPAAPAPQGIDAGQLLGVLACALDLDPADLDTQSPLETVRRVGAALNGAVGGLHRLLRQQGDTGDDTGGDSGGNSGGGAGGGAGAMTMSADAARTVLRRLLAPHDEAPSAGTLADVVARACAHQAALAAGRRAALRAALESVAPAAVERRVGRPGAVGRVLPAFHRARLWAGFLALHGEQERQAQERSGPSPEGAAARDGAAPRR